MNGRKLLAAWLEEAGTSHAAFAALVGCSPALVSLLLSGKRLPGRWTGSEIERVTKGAVPSKAWGNGKKAFHARRIAKVAQ